MTHTSLQKKLEQHPLYPSLLSVPDVLYHYRVENQTARLSIEMHKTLDQPFLALLKAENSDIAYYCLINSVSSEGTVLLNSKTDKDNKYDWTEIEKLYQGIVLIAEVDETSGEKDFKRERTLEIIDRVTTDLLFLYIPILTLVVGKGFGQNILPFIYSLLSLTGCVVASLLFWFEVGKSNTVFHEVCAGKTDNRFLNRGLILNSKASSFLGVSWSVWGTTFFLSIIFGQLLNGFSNRETLQYLAMLSILAAWYIPFSIYYTWKVVKQWCRSCLTIQCILFIQFLIVIFSNNFNSTFLFAGSGLSWHGLGIFAALGILCFLLFNQIINLLNTSNSDKRNSIESMRVKFDLIVFDFTLKRQKADRYRIFLEVEAKKNLIDLCGYLSLEEGQVTRCCLLN